MGLFCLTLPASCFYPKSQGEQMKRKVANLKNCCFITNLPTNLFLSSVFFIEHESNIIIKIDMTKIYVEK